MKRALLVVAILVSPGAALAEDLLPEDYVQRGSILAADAMVPIGRRMVKSVEFDPTLPTIRLVVVSTLGREPTPPAEEEKYRKYYEEAGVYMSYALDVKLAAEDKEHLVVRCDSGGSNDPQCVFSASPNPEQPGTAIPGTLFVIPGDGCIYSSGHTNTMFAARALHCRKDGALQNVAQPFAYAGLRSIALRKLTLYADRQKSGIVTTIAEGSFVEVLLQDGDLFMLRDRFGLTGWAALEQSQQAVDIADFFYNGD